MEQARRTPPRDNGDEAKRTRPRIGPQKTGLEGLDNVLRLAFPPDEPGEHGPDRKGPTERDWVKTLYLVDQAADALRAAEERIRDLEARNEELVQRATDELKAAQSMVKAAEARANRADERAKAAEDQARVDRDWLMRIHDAMEHLHAPRK